MKLNLGLGFGNHFGASGTQFNFYVDAQNGNDSNDGLTLETAKATFAAAYGAASSGNSIGLAAGQYHPHDGSDIGDISLGKFGEGDDPIMDARQDLSSLTWTLHSGNVWTTDVTFRDETSGNGTIDNTNYLGLWIDEVFRTRQVGGADIAANIASVESNAGTWTIHADGSTNENAQDDADTDFVVYVHMPDSGNPNGENIKIADVSGTSFTGTFTANNIQFIGENGKDSHSLAYTTGRSFRNCTFLDFGSHGHVGFGVFRDHTAIGQVRASMDNSGEGRTTGGCMNIYTSVDNSDKDVNLHNLTLQNGSNGLYGHGGGNPGYNQVNITGTFAVSNCNTGMKFDPIPTTRAEFIVNGVNCTATLDFDNIDVAFSVDSDWSFTGGGSITLGPDIFSSNNDTTLVGFNGDNCSLYLKDTTIEADNNPTPFSGYNQLFSRGTSDAFETPTLTLDNVQDANYDNAKHFTFYNGGGSTAIIHQIHLNLLNGTTLGNMYDIDSRTNLPESLTVGDGCTFGIGDNTGPELEEMLYDAGVTYFISRNTTILNIDGTTASSNPWTHAVPSAFGSGDWSLTPTGADELTINIISVPAAGDTATKDFEYRIDGGSPISMGTATTGDVAISGLSAGTTYYIEIRAVNAGGQSDWSDLKSSNLYIADAFVTEWETTSPSESITLPASNTGTYSCTVDWGDGTTSDITAYDDADLTHTYTDAGTYLVQVSGTFPDWAFDLSGDRMKIKYIRQWGDVGFETLSGFMQGCTNLDVTATDVPNLSAATNMNGAFYGCTSITDIPNIDQWDVSTITFMQFAFRQCTFNPNIGGWDTSSLENCLQLFRLCTGFDRDLSGWDVTNLTDASGMFQDATAFSRANYDALLVGWEAQSVQNGVTLGAPDTNYTADSAAETARTALINDHSWTINDNGEYDPTQGMTLDATWDDTDTDYSDLADAVAATIKINANFDDADTGVLFESGASASGISVVIFGGTLYFQAGEGSNDGPDSDTLNLSWDVPSGAAADYEIIVSADAGSNDKGALYINRELIGTGAFSPSNGKIAGGNVGTISQVTGTARSNPGGWGADGDGVFTGTVTNALIYVGEVTSDVTS